MCTVNKSYAIHKCEQLILSFSLLNNVWFACDKNYLENAIMVEFFY